MKNIVSIAICCVLISSCGGGGGGGGVPSTATASGSPTAAIGDSLSWHLAGWMEADNLAISGGTTVMLIEDVQKRDLSGYQKIYLMAGINDVYSDLDRATILNNYSDLIDIIRAKTKARIIVQSILPTMNIDRNDFIMGVNRGIQNLAISKGCNYVDLWCVFLDVRTGLLKMNYDEVHLTEDGYGQWASYMKAIQ